MDTTFKIGEVLGTGFRIWFKNIVPFLVITTIFYAPLWVWLVSATGGELTTDGIEHLETVTNAVTFIAIPINFLVSAAVTYGVVMELQGQRASIGACIATGFARFFPSLGVGLLSSLCIGLASIALIIPGIIVYCMLYVAMPASVIERPGVGGALSRSSDLTKGHKLQIFGLLLLLALLSIGLVLALGLFHGVPHDRQPRAVFDYLSRTAYYNLAEQMITGSISATMASVAYYYLRYEKEGTSATELAAVFE